MSDGCGNTILIKSFRLKNRCTLGCSSSGQLRRPQSRTFCWYFAIMRRLRTVDAVEAKERGDYGGSLSSGKAEV